jgi:L-fucose isomerase-like protein
MDETDPSDKATRQIRSPIVNESKFEDFVKWVHQEAKARKRGLSQTDIATGRRMSQGLTKKYLGEAALRKRLRETKIYRDGGPSELLFGP